MVTHEAWSLRDTKTIFHMKDGEVIDVEKTQKDTVVESLSNHLYEQMVSVSGEEEANKNKEEKISARILANFLLRGYSMDEIRRFESFVNERFENKIDKNQFRNLVNKPFKDGGVGLWHKKTDRVADYLEAVIDKRKDIACIYDIIEKNPELPINNEVHEIRNWLIEGYTGKLSQLQTMALDQVISDRIRDNIPADKIVEVLDLSSNKYGVGLSFRAAQLMAEKLELILSNDIEKNDCNINLENT